VVAGAVFGEGSRHDSGAGWAIEQAVPGVGGRAIANPPITAYDVVVRTLLSPPSGRGMTPRVILAAALLSFASCGGGRVVNPFTGTVTGGVEQPIRIEVQNLNFNDATVYAMRSTQAIRLGRVTGKTDQEFRIEWNVAQSIAFRVDVVGGRSCRTGEVIVEADSRVWVTIPSDMGFGACRAGRR